MTEDQNEKPMSAAEFVLAEVRANPAISYGELQAKAELKGFKVFPILFGRAKRMVALEGGRAPAPPSEEKPFADSVSTEPVRGAPPKRGRGRPMSPEMAFAIEFLESAPRAKARDVQAAASRNGLEVTSALVSRARMRLGPAKTRAGDGDGDREPASLPRATVAQALERRPTNEEAPQPRVVGREGAFPAFDIQAIVDSIRNLEAERDGLRDALAEISVVLERIREPD